MKHKSKADRQQQQVEKAKKEEGIILALEFSRKRFKRFDEIITALAAGADLSAHYADSRISQLKIAFDHYTGKKKDQDRAVQRDVYLHLYRNSLLTKGPDYIRTVHNMVLFKRYWYNNPLGWKPVSKKGQQQIRELANYLFCKYPVPAFLYRAFNEEKKLQYIHWFIHLGKGGRMKDITGFPLPFTNKMNHWFLNAPERFSIPEAIRWAQVKGLGGSDGLAERVAWSWLGTKPCDNEKFWEDFLRVLINGGMFNLDKLTELIDYVREIKREYPLFNMKGRTLYSLVRQSDQWHKHYSLVPVLIEWKSCGIRGMVKENEKERVVLSELISNQQLAAEGKAMRHCVASYSFHCNRGRSAIYSLRKYSGNVLLTRLATIEVNLLNRRIVQAKGRMNAPVTGEVKKLLNYWAAKTGLEMGMYL